VKSVVPTASTGDPTGRVSGTDFAVGLAAVQLAAAAVICIVASAIDSAGPTGFPVGLTVELFREAFKK